MAEALPTADAVRALISAAEMRSGNLDTFEAHADPLDPELRLALAAVLADTLVNSSCIRVSAACCFRRSYMT